MSEGWQRETRLTGVINAARCFLHQILDGLEISFYVRTVRTNPMRKGGLIENGFQTRKK